MLESDQMIKEQASSGCLMLEEISRLRSLLKTFESNFIKQHRRKPNKTDIDEAADNIKDSYTKYANLKKSLLAQDSGTIVCTKIAEDTNADQSSTGSKKEIDNRTCDSGEEMVVEAINKKSAMKVEVWGSQFDRKTYHNTTDSTLLHKKSDDSQSFIGRLGQKMFQQSQKLGSAKNMKTQTEKLNRTPWQNLNLTQPSQGVLEKPAACRGDLGESSGTMDILKAEAETGKETNKVEEDEINIKPFDTMLEKAMSIVKQKISSSHTDQDSDICLAKFKRNWKGKQSFLPKNLTKILSKHRAEMNLEEELMDVTDEDIDDIFKNNDEFEYNEGDYNHEKLQESTHSWNTSVKNLIAQDKFGTTVNETGKHEKSINKYRTNARKAKSINHLSETDITGNIEKYVKPNILLESALPDKYREENASLDTQNCDVYRKQNYTENAQTVESERKTLDFSDDDVDWQPAMRRNKATSGNVKVGRNIDKAKSVQAFIVNEEIEEKTCRENDNEDCLPQNKVNKRKKATDNDKEGQPAGKKRKTNNVDLTGASEDRKQSKTKSKVPAVRSKAISSGNFVRLNMKVKTYKRKGKHMTGPQYKRMMWKQKMQARSKSFGDACFKCGQSGHWANKCPGTQPANNDDREPLLEDDFPSLREAAMMAKCCKVKQKEKVLLQTDQDVPTASTEHADPAMNEELEIQSGIIRSQQVPSPAPLGMRPLIELQELGELPVTPDFVFKALKKFGFEEFRPGQEEAVMRILCGLSTLVVLSTGGGKSLCYQLPAYLYAQRSPCITLVISPLVSLMEDQVTGLPYGIRGVCLHTNMTPNQRENVLAAVKSGKSQFLLVSPEAVAGGSMSLLSSLASLPPVAFVCIDEAHCLSEWSHNFRPSYLRLCKVLQQKLGIQCFLGLTATATLTTASDVARHMKISDCHKAMVRESPVPKNLILSVSRDANRDEALVHLLKDERFGGLESIIIYCTRRDQTDRVATIIRTSMNTGVPLEDQKSSRRPKGPKLEWSAESYHAGLQAAQRKRVQNAFMSGRLRVVVATVAFGMGLDKSNVRGVIHYNMPKSFESYVQEIGRAGRDGLEAHCHVFLDPEESKEKAVSVSENHTDMALTCLTPDVCNEVALTTDTEVLPGGRLCPGHERALPIQQAVMELDVKEEGISTLLCYLELHCSQWLENMSNVYATCKVQCYGGPNQLQALAKKCPPIAVAIAKGKKEGKIYHNKNSVDFNVIDISDSMGWDSGPVKKELKLLQWNFEVGKVPSRTGILVDFSDLAYHFRTPGDFTAEELDDILQYLHERVQKQEKKELLNLSRLYQALKGVSHKNYWMCSDDVDMSKNDRLKDILNQYFDQHLITDEAATAHRLENEPVPEFSLDQLVSDIRQFYNTYSQEHSLNGRAIARIFHGITSPCFPATTWGRVRKFWRSHLEVDFNTLIKIATKELVSFRF